MERNIPTNADDFMKMYECEYRMHLKLIININKIISYMDGDPKIYPKVTTPENYRKLYENIENYMRMYESIRSLMVKHHDETLSIAHHWDVEKIDRVNYK